MATDLVSLRTYLQAQNARRIPQPSRVGLSLTNNTQTSSLGTFNSIQAYLTLTYTARVYNGTVKNYRKLTQSSAPVEVEESPVTPLSARTFGTWTLLSSVIRIYAAYNINNPIMYQLAVCTYVIAGFHFYSEWLVFGSAKLGAGIAGPLVVASLSLVWMVSAWGYYVK